MQTNFRTNNCDIKSEASKTINIIVMIILKNNNSIISIIINFINIIVLMNIKWYNKLITIYKYKITVRTIHDNNHDQRTNLLFRAIFLILSITNKSIMSRRNV